MGSTPTCSRFTLAGELRLFRNWAKWQPWSSRFTLAGELRRLAHDRIVYLGISRFTLAGELRPAEKAPNQVAGGSRFTLAGELRPTASGSASHAEGSRFTLAGELRRQKCTENTAHLRRITCNSHSSIMTYAIPTLYMTRTRHHTTGFIRLLWCGPPQKNCGLTVHTGMGRASIPSLLWMKKVIYIASCDDA